MTAPQEFYAEDFKTLLQNQTQVWNEFAAAYVWVPARPMTFNGRWDIFNRLWLAFRVFMGWSDVVTFHNQN